MRKERYHQLEKKATSLMEVRSEKFGRRKREGSARGGKEAALVPQDKRGNSLENRSILIEARGEIWRLPNQRKILGKRKSRYSFGGGRKGGTPQRGDGTGGMNGKGVFFRKKEKKCPKKHTNGHLGGKGSPPH